MIINSFDYLPKELGLRSNRRLSESAAKIVLDYVTRRLNASSAGLESRLGSLTFAEAPLSAISRFNWSPESPEVRPLSKGSREDGSSFRADLEQSNPNKNNDRFMKFVTLRTDRNHRRRKSHKSLKTEETTL